MPLPPWPELAMFMALVLVVCTYIMAASGHFPRENRTNRLTTPVGTAVLWATILVTIAIGLATLAFAYLAVPWYAAVIGGGLMMLIAPFTLQPFPDRFVDGPGVLVLLTAAGLALGAGAWRMVA